MDKIQKFVYINLKKREDRNKHILEELKKFNVPEEKILRFEAVEHPRGNIGCSMSHQKVMEMFRDSGDDVWCILEDDHYFTQTYEKTDELIQGFIDREPFDVLLGCTCALYASPIVGDDKYVRVLQSSTSSFYIVKKRACEGLLASHKNSVRSFGKDFKRRGVNLDHMWYHLMKIFVFVTPYFCPIGAQLDNYSDIRKKKINYSNYLKQKIDRTLPEEEVKETEKVEDVKKD